MKSFADRLDQAAAAAACGVLTSGGSALIGAGAWGVAAGGAGFGAIGLGAASLMAANMVGCNDGWDPAGPPQGGGAVPPNFCFEGASKFILRNFANDTLTSESTPISSLIDWRYLGDPACQGVTDGSLALYELRYRVNPGDDPSGWQSKFGTCNGITYTTTQTFVGSSACNVPGPVFPPPFTVPPYEYTDPDDGCNITVDFKGLAYNSAGGASPVYKMLPGPELLREGGRIGGCNFSPVLYYSPVIGEPPAVGPWKPEWDDPDSPLFPWGDTLDGIVGGVVGNIVAEEVSKLIGADVPASFWKLNSVCELDASGNPEQRIIEIDIPPLPDTDAIIARLDALPILLQGQKDFKQPICPPAKASGDLRTISFRSEQVSPNGKSCLRKRLRYRSISGIGLDGLIDHWKDFSFEAGPVLVKHVGSTLGTIKCWAASVDEGKRVILHAFGEAGVDANQAGRWEVSGSSSTRLGMPGTMNVDTTGGYYWITARDGSNNRPMVGET